LESCVDNHRTALFGHGGAGGERIAAAVCRQPGKQGRRLQAEIDESRSGNRKIEVRREVAEFFDQGFGHGTRVLALLLCIGQSAVCLKVAVDRIGSPNAGGKTGFGEPGAAGGTRERPIDGLGKIEAEIHPVTQQTV